MEKGGKFDKWVIRLLGGENTNDGNPQKSENSSYEELLLQEEAHRQALEQQLLDAKSEREFLAAEARAEAQHQREMLRIKNDAIALDRKRERDAIALDQQRQKNMEFMADFRRENPTVTSIINNGDSFEVTWDPSLNINSKKSNKEVECANCSETTPAAAFCSYCGHKL